MHTCHMGFSRPYLDFAAVNKLMLLAFLSMLLAFLPLQRGFLTA